MKIYNDGYQRNGLGKRIKEARNHKKISSESLAGLIDVSSGGFIRTVESGNSGITLDTFADICNALGCSADFLLTYSLNKDFDFANKMSKLRAKIIGRWLMIEPSAYLSKEKYYDNTQSTF